MLTAVSLFAGVGGFDLAFKRAGIKVTAAVEIDKKCRDVLALQFPETKLFDDVKEVTGEQLKSAGFIPERGIIAGGFPCQDLSIAGLRKGLGGERSGLFHEIIRLTDELKPQFLILENVAGLLSSKQGKDMGIVITALVERGYGVCWRMLDSQNFGVPQRRRRVFIVASLGDHRKPAEILFERESGFWNLETSRKKRKATTDSTKRSVGVNSFQKAKRAQSVDDYESWVESETVPTLNVFDSGDSRTTTIVRQEPILFEGNRVGDPRFHDKVSPSVMARWGTGGNNVPMAFNMRSDDTNNRMDVYEANTATSLTALQPSPLSHRSQTFIAQRQSNSEYKIDDKASTISQRDYKSATDLVINNPIPIQDGREINKKQNGSGIGYENAPAYTLDTLGAQAIATNIVRRLTPKECERLQGFPDDWTASQADSSRYKMMGNAVTVPVVEWIARRMVKLVTE
jgi:DNA (cytosine-5)-methyltransferase 1